MFKYPFRLPFDCSLSSSFAASGFGSSMFNSQLYWDSILVYCPGTVENGTHLKDSAKALGDYPMLMSGGPCLTFNGTSDYGTIDGVDLGQLPYTDVAMDGHQGVIVTPDYIYIINTEQIDKRERFYPYALVDSNTDPLNGILNVNHLGDGCYHNNKLYIVCERWIDCVDNSDHYLLVFDPTTLERESAYQLSDNDHEVSGCASDGTDLYVTSYCFDDRIWKYSDTGVLQSIIMLSEDSVDMQGATIFNDEIYLAASNNGIKVYDLSGTYKRTCVFGGLNVYYEGLDFTDSDLNICFILSPTSSLRVFDIKQKYVTGFCVAASIDQAANTGERAIVSSYKYDSNYRQFYLYTVENTLYFKNGNGTGSSQVSVSINSDPHIISGTYDSSDKTLKIDVDGTVTSASSVTDYRLFDQPIGIGRLVNTPVSAFYAGTVWDVKLGTLLKDGAFVEVEFPCIGKTDTVNPTSTFSTDGKEMTIVSSDYPSIWAGTQSTYFYEASYGYYEDANGRYPYAHTGATYHTPGWNNPMNSFAFSTPGTPAPAAIQAVDAVHQLFTDVSGDSVDNTQAEILVGCNSNKQYYFSDCLVIYNEVLSDAQDTIVRAKLGIAPA